MSNKLRIIVLVVAFSVLLFCGYKLWDTYSNYSQADRAYEQTVQNYVSAAPAADKTEKAENTGTVNTTPDAETNTETDGVETQTQPQEPDWDKYSRPAPITVDFDTMLAEWPDVVGWLYCEGTPINYPVMQGENNDQYLHHLPDGTYNFSGSLFMEWTNEADLSDLNTIIYGHSMKNDTMFGSLLYYEDADYYLEHPTMWYLTPTGNYRLDLVAGYYTPAGSAIYDICINREDFEKYVTICMGESTFDAGIAVEDISQVVVLSTCSKAYDNARFVIVARVVPCWDGGDAVAETG